MHILVHIAILSILTAVLCADTDIVVGYYLIARNSPLGRPKALTLSSEGAVSFEDLEKNNSKQILKNRKWKDGTICLKNSSNTCIKAKKLKVDRKKKYPRKLDAIFCPLNYRKSKLVLNIMPYRDNVLVKIKGCHLLCLFSNPRDTKPDAEEYDPHISHCAQGNINNMFIFVSEDRIDGYIAEQEQDKDDLEEIAGEEADGLSNPPSMNVPLSSLSQQGALTQLKSKTNLRRYFLNSNSASGRKTSSFGGSQALRSMYT